MKQETKAVNSKISLNHIISLVDIHKISEDQQNFHEHYSIVSVEANINLVNLSANESLGLCIRKLGYEDKRSIMIHAPGYSVFRMLLHNCNIESATKNLKLPTNSLFKYYANTLFMVGYNTKLLAASFQGNYLYLLDKRFTIVKVLNLKKLKKLGIRKKSDLTFIYDDKKLTKSISLFSNYNRQAFCEELMKEVSSIIVDSCDQEKLSTVNKITTPSEILFNRQLILQLLESSDPWRVSQFFQYFNAIIRDQLPKSIYSFEGLYCQLQSSVLNHKTNLCAYFFNLEVMSLTVSNLFYSFKNLSFDFSKDVNYQNYLKLKSKQIVEESQQEMKESQRKRLNTATDMLIKGRIRHNIIDSKKRKKGVGGKCIYKNISFTYFITRNHNSKNPKSVSVSTGSFTVMKSQTPHTYNMKSIERLNTEGENDCYLQVFIGAAGDLSKRQETLEFYFVNPYEKYLFQTLIYNFFVFSLDRKIVGNHLLINCNVMTWNLAGIDVPKDLYPLFNSKSLDKVDLIALGVQECGLFKIADWMKTLKRILNYYNFQEVAITNMFQMFLIVFIKQDLYPLIDSISTDIKPMGFAKILGNKGGMIISFKLAGFRMVFINCHLAPKPHKVLERNKHAKNLISSLRVGSKTAEFDTQSDYLFWMGDMNYRVDYIYDQVLEEISRNNLQLLLSKDQLIRQKQQNQIFTDFQEAEINFWPTYRRIKGTDLYSNKKNQSPSWCDRVLIKTERYIDILFYDSIQEVNLSDHLPVLSKSTLYMTMPIIEEIDKLMEQKVQGTICFSNIQVDYNFTEGLSELEIDLALPVKIKLSVHFFTNDKKCESKSLCLKTLDDFNLLEFEDIYVPCPPQFLFDLPHAKSMSFVWVLSMTMNGTYYEIGFSKYSLENIEALDGNLMSHSHEMLINFRTRNMGKISFDATYKM